MISEAERAAQWVLWSIEGIGPKRLRALIDYCGGQVSPFWSLSREEVVAFCSANNYSRSLINKVLLKLNDNASQLYRRELAALPPTALLVHYSDGMYPRQLLELDNPPFFVYKWGQVHDNDDNKQAIAFVGSRRVCVRYGQITNQLATAISKRGISIISGGALGVDGIAHRSALAVGSSTVAILPGGFGHLTPRRHRAMFNEIIKYGCLITEYPIGTKPRPYFFPRRNQLIAAISDGVVVIRAALKSGTMHTARAALELQRPLCVLPAELDDRAGEGNLELLYSGARLVRDEYDIMKCVYEHHVDTIDELPTNHFAHVKRRQKELDTSTHLMTNMSPQSQTILRAIQDGTTCVDEIVNKTGLPVAVVLQRLIELEVSKIIAKVPGINAYRTL